VRPYIACDNALFATVHSWLDFTGRSARAILSSQMFAPEHWFLAYSTCYEGKSESHCRTEQSAPGRADGHQPVLPPRGDVRELGLPQALRFHQETVHRRDEARRSADGEDSVSGWQPVHATAGVEGRRNGQDDARER